MSQLFTENISESLSLKIRGDFTHYSVFKEKPRQDLSFSWGFYYKSSEKVVNEAYPKKDTCFFKSKTNPTFQEVDSIIGFIKILASLKECGEYTSNLFNSKLSDKTFDVQKTK
ncbi:MAG: hypothetical protein SFY56_10595 [Bacteroidota bacterium]|nr:hypothetical protein [Bacteroidota bacterium]